MTEAANVETMDIVILYHAECNDGYTAMWYLDRTLRDMLDYTIELFEIETNKALVKGFREDELPVLKYNIETKAVYYGDPVDVGFIKGKNVFIVDFSYPVDQLSLIHEHALTSVVIDHHESAEKLFEYIEPHQDWEGGIRAYLDLLDPFTVKEEYKFRQHEFFYMPNTMSGAGMVHAFVGIPFQDPAAILQRQLVWNNGGAALLCMYAQDRDIWKFELENSHAINAYMVSFVRDKTNFDIMANEIVHNYVGCVRIGQAVIKRQEQYYEEVIQPHRLMWCHVTRPDEMVLYTILCTNCQYSMRSTVANKIIHRYDETVAATFFVQPDGRLQFSIRGNQEREPGSAKRIAEAFGGGGHANAAGFTVDMNQIRFSPFRGVPHNGE